MDRGRRVNDFERESIQRGEPLRERDMALDKPQKNEFPG